jgi:hypothetical protein
MNSLSCEQLIPIRFRAIDREKTLLIVIDSLYVCVSRIKCNPTFSSSHEIDKTPDLFESSIKVSESRQTARRNAMCHAIDGHTAQIE